MIDLVLSLDYELFGSGAGDVRRDIIEPTSRVLEICKKHDCPLTLMFEVAEYWAFRQAENEGKLKLGYSPADLIEKQLIAAVANGHDVQLHIHPQWIGAEIVDGLWRLKMQQYRLSDLPGGLGSRNDPLSIWGVLHRGRETIERLLQPYKKSYECRVFRAGGYYMQPSERVIAAMKEVGLYADSSVVPGLRLKRPFALNYTQAVKNIGFWWCAADDVCKTGPEFENVIEFPVCAVSKPYLMNFMPRKLLATVKRKLIEEGDRHGEINRLRSTPDVKEVLFNLFRMHTHNLDFCKLSARSMYKMVLRFGRSATEEITPVVMIGHSKDFWNDRELDNFLKMIKKVENVRFSSFGDLVEKIPMAPLVDGGIQYPAGCLFCE
ncbi:MAG: hypothetical protein JXR80_11425 [Deltaproteobacteria bacterium]|nr:hypothetical protein [Deltaproteobacteria bacterium]